MKKVLGEQFAGLSAADTEALIQDLIDYEKKDALARRFVKKYGLPAEKAEELAEVTVEEGYCRLSRKALRKLLPELEKGVPFATAKASIYGPEVAGERVFDRLPPVLEAVPSLRNPVVTRGLTELRKVVNAVIREYGKPAGIRVELARDLKRSRSQRNDIAKTNRANEKRREEAKKKIQTECNIADPRPGDILKVQLAEECGWVCPYTGEQISVHTLIGASPRFDIEHIIPFSRSLDNSFANKTLCQHEENRKGKGNRTPYEAYAGDDARYQEILARVRRFKGPAAHAKLRKFQQKEIDTDFVAKQLQDTRYMSRLAAEYLGLLYGQVGPAGKRYVQVSPGRVTAYLRDQWGLNAILAADDRDRKNRYDHRHHAVDAVAIAMANPRTVQLLSRAAAKAEQIGRRLFVPVDPPWPGFLDEVRQTIDAIHVSYRVNRRVRGKLHEDTFYSKPHVASDKNGKPVEYRHVRKPLARMSTNEVGAIVDDQVRQRVQEKLNQIGADPKKAFADGNNFPYLKAKDGRIIPIRKARIRIPKAVIQVGSTASPRYVAPGSNHHMEIVAVLDDDGCEKRWEAHIVTLFEAHQRLRRHEPIVQRNHGPNKRFKFSLCGGEYVEMYHDSDTPQPFRVVVISGSQIEFRLHCDARPTTLLKKKEFSSGRVRKGVDSLRKANARKVTVDPLGNILPAHD